MSKQKLTFEIHSEQELIPRQVPCQRVLELALQAPSATSPTERIPLNLALVIDRSGSMSGGKLENVKQAALHVLDQLQDCDRIAITAYDDEVLVVSESVAVTSAAKADLRVRIQELRTGGSTNLCEGWLRGCQFIADTLLEKGVNRALLLTDGLANVGVTDLEELATHAKQLHRRGVSTSTFGVGTDFNEHLLEAMANQGGGNFYFISSPNLIPELFQREFKELSTVTARDVEITLTLPDAVDAQVLGGWKFEKQTNKLVISAGSIAADQRRELYLKLLLPPHAKKEKLEFQAAARAKGEEGILLEEKITFTFRYADKAAVDAAQNDHALLERFSLVEVADAATEALKLERQGRREEAHNMLNLALAAAPALPEAEAMRYRKIAERARRGMDEQDRKATHYAQYIGKQRRTNPLKDEDQNT
jgi:Ca-activated chloride channel family protein